MHLTRAHAEIYSIQGMHTSEHLGDIAKSYSLCFGHRRGPEAEAITFRNVSKVFGGVHALDAVDFSVGAGEVHCLAGENGCGKSTLIKIITGVYQPEAGAQMQLFGQALPQI